MGNLRIKDRVARVEFPLEKHFLAGELAEVIFLEDGLGELTPAKLIERVKSTIFENGRVRYDYITDDTYIKEILNERGEEIEAYLKEHFLIDADTGTVKTLKADKEYGYSLSECDRILSGYQEPERLKNWVREFLGPVPAGLRKG